MKYAILSALKFVSQIQEDILLKEKLNINDECDIIAWETLSQEDIENYDVFIIRSVWGYHLEHEEFLKTIEKINNSGKKIINKYQNICDNISKEIQYKFCKTNDLKIIPSYFLSHAKFNITEISKELGIATENEIVVKPIISASGDGVKKMLLSDFNINNFKQYINNKSQGIVLQPFVNSIKNGEYSAVVIEDKLQYIVLRYPGVIEKEKRVQIIDKVPDKLLKAVEKSILAIKKLKTSYYRLDFFYYLDDYYINEIEMTDPDLFTRKIDKSLANITITNFANVINKNTNK